MTDNDEPRVAVPPIHPLGTRLIARTDSGPRAPKWRVEIVEDDYVRVKHEEIVDNWWAARTKLAEIVAAFLDGPFVSSGPDGVKESASNPCMDCRLRATDAFNRLAALSSPQEFEADIDGDLYRIMLINPED